VDDPSPSDALAVIAEAIGPGVSDRTFFLALLHDHEKLVERIFNERESSAEFKRVSLKEAVDKAAETTETRLAEAKSTTDQQLVDAKTAADEREKVIQDRLSKLEAGGAPFASRLDESLKKMREDVDVLNTDAVRTKVLDALRDQQREEAKQQKRAVRLAIGTAAVSIMLVLIQVLARALGGG
jgi:hypothetical protein